MTHSGLESITQNLDRPITLVGMMASGKSHVGKVLAETLGLEFIDMDRVIIERAGMSIPEIFAKKGEDYFRDLEQTVVTEVIGDTHKAKKCVVATGGGAVIRPANADIIFGHSLSIWVRASIPTILERTKFSTDRPLLKSGNPKKVLEDLAKVRNPIYERAEIIVDTDHARPLDIVANIIETLGRRKTS